MYKVSDDKMIFCPYNRSHVVSKLRIQSHIVKCKKNHPNVKLATCFFNYTHRLKPEDMLEHYETCSHKARIDGARECNTNISFPKILEKNIPFVTSFPDINVQPKVFYSSPEYSLSPPINDDDSSSGYSDSTSDYSDSSSISDNIDLEAMSVNIEQTWLLDNNTLEPLPLPKTVSKAFTGFKHSTDHSANTSVVIENDSETNVLEVSSNSPKTCDDALSSLNNIKTVEPSRIKNSTIELKSEYCSTSVSSSLLDDTATFKSDDIIFDDIYNEDESDVDINQSRGGKKNF